MELFKFKIDKELTNKIYQLIEIAKNTGKIKRLKEGMQNWLLLQKI